MKNNGYSMMSESYNRMLDKGIIDKTTAQKAIRIYDFLADCDSDDIYQMVDSSAFNDIIKAYTKIALNKANIDSETQDKIMNQLRWIFDEKQAKEVLENV